MSEKKTGHVCAIKSCNNKRYNCKKRFFRFPKQPDRAKVWIMLADREDLLEKLKSLHKSHRLCEDHFEPTMFTNHLHERLNVKAFPTLFPSLEGRSGYTDHTYSMPLLLPSKALENIIIFPAIAQETLQVDSGSSLTEETKKDAIKKDPFESKESLDQQILKSKELIKFAEVKEETICLKESDISIERKILPFEEKLVNPPFIQPEQLTYLTKVEKEIHIKEEICIKEEYIHESEKDLFMEEQELN